MHVLKGQSEEPGYDNINPEECQPHNPANIATFGKFLWASHDGMQIDLIRYKPLTLSLRRILNYFSNSFLNFYRHEGFSSSDIRKNET